MVMQQASYAGHFVSMNYLERARFGYAFKMEENSLPMIGDMEFLMEVLDGEPRMPVARVDPEEVIKDYGVAEDFESLHPRLLPWINRFYLSGEDNTLLLFRAAIIAVGELKLEDADAGLLETLRAARDKRLAPKDWTDDEVAAVLQLSRNEALRSIQDVENRKKLAALLAERLNRDD